MMKIMENETIDKYVRFHGLIFSFNNTIRFCCFCKSLFEIYLEFESFMQCNGMNFGYETHTIRL